MEERTEADISSASDAVTINPLRVSWGHCDAFIVGYSGNMGRAHRLDGLIDAAFALRLQPGLRFVLIGDGAQRAALQGRVKDSRWKVIFQPYQPRDRLRESLGLPDIHIVSLDERLEGLIVPSKFVGVIAMGRPVVWIGAPDGEVGSLIQASGCGVTVPTGHAAALTQTLRELSDDHARGGARLRTMAHHAQALWSARFRRRDALAAWAATIERFAPPTVMTFVIHIAFIFFFVAVHQHVDATLKRC